ncbi:hypothetical protein R5M92_12735 [Halomonas sp. Bachu 37]|uniref:hypothetical protein n=1 Tax=Halomonas kashgarensis TaxID=3084920 RepID=UPI0032178D82
MTATTELLGKARKEFLSSLKDPEVSTEHLRGLLNQARQHSPELLSGFQPGIEKSIPSSKSKDWNTAYFSRHIRLAEHNFARERIEHLIEVREYLREQGVKGFVPSPRSPSHLQTGSPHNVASNHTPSDNLQKFVASSDLLAIRTALRMELHRNSLTSEDLRTDLAWTKARVPDLFETYSEKAFARGMESDRQLWDSQYYADQVVYLKTNFSEERFHHLIEVRGLLRQQGVEGFAARPTQPRASTSTSTSTSPTSYSPASAQPQGGQSQHGNASNSNPEHNPVFRTALMMGGAVAALAVLLIALINGRS